MYTHKHTQPRTQHNVKVRWLLWFKMSVLTDICIDMSLPLAVTSLYWCKGWTTCHSHDITAIANHNHPINSRSSSLHFFSSLRSHFTWIYIIIKKTIATVSTDLMSHVFVFAHLHRHKGQTCLKFDG